MQTSTPRPITYFAALCWLIVIAMGITLTGLHAARPGDSGHPSISWPEETAIFRNRDAPNLLIFIHPRCPCSLTSLVELNRIMQRYAGKVSIIGVLYQPRHSSEAWNRGEIGIEQALEDHKEIKCFLDIDARESRRFGVSTSGHVLLFNVNGALLFSGGITQFRGHEGKSRSGDALLNRLLHPEDEARLLSESNYPVFGCPILSNQGQIQGFQGKDT